MDTTTEAEIAARLDTANEEMLHCLELAHIAAHSPTPVLITGENGAGKSLLALHIHQNSPRSDKPCLSLNCATLPGKDFKRIMMGEGRSEPGIMARADGGTLIIDGVDMLPPHAQQELFLALNNSGGISGRYRQAIAFGPRLISISGSELSQKAANGLFIQELLYGIGEITIRVPPLRNRKEDLPELTRLAIAQANRVHGKNVGGLSRTALDFIQHYHFPGNVRELFLIINRAVRETSRDTIYVEDLGLMVDPVDDDSHNYANLTLLPLFEMERRHIAKALLRTGWKKRSAARLLCIPLSSLERKIKLYRLERGGDTELADL